MIPGNSILLIGIGNPAASDDGLGRAFIDRIESLHLRGVETLSDEQLQPEWAVDFRGRRVVVIADADLGCEGPYRLRRITPDPFAPFSTHALPPAALAGLAQQLFHATPACYVLGMRPIDLTRFREGLSPGAMENLDAALSFLLPLLADAETLASAVEIGTERAAANR